MMVNMVNIGKNINLRKSALLKTSAILSPVFFLIITTVINKTNFAITTIILASIKYDLFISAILLNSDIFTQKVR